MMSRDNIDPKRLREYDRAMLSSAFVSILWGAMSEKGKARPGLLEEVARQLGCTVKQIDAIFLNDRPISLSRAAAIASALGVVFQVKAVDQKTGAVFTPSGRDDKRIIAD